MLGSSLLVALALVFAPAPQSILVDQLEWMDGHWLDPGDFPRQGPRFSELFWTREYRWEMFGLQRTHDGFDRRTFDYFRIAQGDDGIVLYRSPEGGTAIRYLLVRAGEAEAVFEHPGAEYPQRITFRRDGGNLVMGSAQLDGSQACERTLLPFEEGIRRGPAGFSPDC